MNFYPGLCCGDASCRSTHQHLVWLKITWAKSRQQDHGVQILEGRIGRISKTCCCCCNCCCCCCDLLLQVGCVFLPCTLGSSPAHRWNDMPPAYRAAQPGLNHLHIFSVHMIRMWIILNYIGHLPILSTTEWPICGVFHTPQCSAMATTCMKSFRKLTTHLCVSTRASLGPSLHVVAWCSRNPGCQGKQQGAMIFTQPIEDLWIRMTSELSEVKKQLRECEEQHSSQSITKLYVTYPGCSTFLDFKKIGSIKAPNVDHFRLAQWSPQQLDVQRP